MKHLKGVLQNNSPKLSTLLPREIFTTHFQGLLLQFAKSHVFYSFVWNCKSANIHACRCVLQHTHKCISCSINEEQILNSNYENILVFEFTGVDLLLPQGKKIGGRLHSSPIHLFRVKEQNSFLTKSAMYRVECSAKKHRQLLLHMAKCCCLTRVILQQV